MKKILMFVATLVWATQSMSEESGTPVESLKVDFVSDPVKMYPVTPLKKALWAGVALVNPGDHYRPVPLYGYSIQDLLAKKIYKKALIEAASGNVHIAVAQQLYESDVYYNVQGISFSSQGEGWNKFKSGNDIKDDGWIFDIKDDSLPRRLPERW